MESSNSDLGWAHRRVAWRPGFPLERKFQSLAYKTDAGGVGPIRNAVGRHLEVIGGIRRRNNCRGTFAMNKDEERGCPNALFVANLPNPLGYSYSNVARTTSCLPFSTWTAMEVAATSARAQV